MFIPLKYTLALISEYQNKPISDKYVYSINSMSMKISASDHAVTHIKAVKHF